MIAKKYTSKSIALSSAMRKGEFKHAILEFHKVDHSGASFQARVFFNNSRASKDTPMTLEKGYAGKFHIFGHGRCWGDTGHCHVQQTPRPFDNRSPHPLTPREVRVEVTDALKRVAQKESKLVITVVPVIYATLEKGEKQDCFHFSGLTLRIRSSYGLLE